MFRTLICDISAVLIPDANTAEYCSKKELESIYERKQTILLTRFSHNASRRTFFRYSGLGDEWNLEKCGSQKLFIQFRNLAIPCDA